MKHFTDIENKKNLIKSSQAGDSDALLFLLMNAEPELESIVQDFAERFTLRNDDKMLLLKKANATYIETIHKFNADDETAMEHFPWFMRKSVEITLRDYCKRHFDPTNRVCVDEDDYKEDELLAS